MAQKTGESQNPWHQQAPQALVTPQPLSAAGYGLKSRHTEARRLDLKRLITKASWFPKYTFTPSIFVFTSHRRLFAVFPLIDIFPQASNIACGKQNELLSPNSKPPTSQFPLFSAKGTLACSEFMFAPWHGKLGS